MKPVNTFSENAARGAPWLSALLAAAAVPLFLHETFREMVHQWDSSDTYRYGYLILPAALFLSWQRRHRLFQITPRHGVMGFFAALAMGVLWIIGYLTQLSAVQQLAMISLIILAVWTVLGTAVTRVLIYPLLYLFFMLPTGEFLVQPLMDFTANFTVAAARLSGVPIYRDGMFLSIPSGNFSVVEACSGIRALIVFAATGTFFAAINFRSARRRVIFIAISILVPIVANGLRAYGIVMLGHFSKMRWVDAHVLIGDVWFALILILMCLVGRRYSDQVRNTAAPSSGSVGPATHGSAWPSAVAAGLSMVIVALIPLSGAALGQALASRPLQDFPELPMPGDSWTFLPDPHSDSKPAYTGDSRTSSGQYVSAAISIDAYIISYANQRKGGELINSLNRLFDRKEWSVAQAQAGSAVLESGRKWPYRSLRIRSKAGGQRLIWYWYLVDGEPTIRPLDVKLRETVNIFSKQKSVSSVVALSAGFDNDAAQIVASLETFLNAFCADTHPPAESHAIGPSPCGRF